MREQERVKTEETTLLIYPFKAQLQAPTALVSKPAHAIQAWGIETEVMCTVGCIKSE